MMNAKKLPIALVLLLSMSTASNYAATTIDVTRPTLFGAHFPTVKVFELNETLRVTTAVGVLTSVMLYIMYKTNPTEPIVNREDQSLFERIAHFIRYRLAGVTEKSLKIKKQAVTPDGTLMEIKDKLPVREGSGLMYNLDKYVFKQLKDITENIGVVGLFAGFLYFIEHGKISVTTK